MARRVLFLGYVVSGKGLQVDEAKVEVVKRWLRPKTITELQSFHNFAFFCRHFISHFSSIMALIIDCMKGSKFLWTNEVEFAFQLTKECLINAPILVLLDFSQPFKLYTNASKVGIRVMLSQNSSPIAFFNEKLFGSKINYSTYDVEFYAVVQAVKHWRHYLFHREFILYTDYDSLRHLHKQNKVSSRYA